MKNRKVVMEFSDGLRTEYESDADPFELHPLEVCSSCMPQSMRENNVRIISIRFYMNDVEVGTVYL